MRCKRQHFWRSFLSSPLILSSLTTAVLVFFCLAVAAGNVMRSNFKLEPLLCRLLHPTSQDDILSSLCSRVCAGLNWPPPVFLFLKLALWRNCYVGAKTVYIILIFSTKADCRVGSRRQRLGPKLPWQTKQRLGVDTRRSSSTSVLLSRALVRQLNSQSEWSDARLTDELRRRFNMSNRPKKSRRGPTSADGAEHTERT